MNNKYNFDEIKKQAQGRWPDILANLGSISWSALQNKHQPCPHCGGEDRYRFDNKDGNGTYICNQCGAGDGWSLLMKIKSWDFSEAAQRVGDYLRVTPIAPNIVPNPVALGKTTEVRGTILRPVPDDAPKIFQDTKKARLLILRTGDDYEFNYNYVWDWFDENGERVGYMARYHKKNGEKVIHQILFCETEDGRKAWCVTSMPENRPLLGIHKLKDSQSPNVLVVEGETTMDAAQKLLPNTPVITWIGGANVPHKSNWAPLQGKRLIIFPDNDDEGLAAVLGYFDNRNNLHKGILHLVEGIAESVKVVPPPKDKPENWDIADALKEGWTSEQLTEYIKNNPREDLTPIKNLKKKKKNNSPAPKDFPKKESPKINFDNYKHGITFLGYTQNSYVFISSHTGVIRELKPSELTKNNLIDLADLDFWEMQFPKAGRESFDLAAAVQWLMRQGAKAKFFNLQKVRGRGSWKDAERYIFNAGDKLIVDEEVISLESIESKYRYLRGESIDVNLENSLTKNDLNLLEEITSNVAWQYKQSGNLLQGFLVISVIGGWLDWRPSIILHSPAGSGKTTLLKKLALKVLGDFCLPALGTSTEAGIRQELHLDALPVIFDECEGEDEQADQRVQKIFGLVRQSSSETGMRTLRGTSGHKAVSFEVRSTFFLAMINMPLKQPADWHRFTILKIRNIKPKDDLEQQMLEAMLDNFARLTDQIDDTFSTRFIARAIKLGPIIVQNVKTISRVIMRKFKSPRFADQVGTLLAGKYSLLSDKVLSDEEAREFVEQYDLGPYTEPLEMSQEKNALSYIMQLEFEYEDSMHFRSKLTIGEALAKCVDLVNSPILSKLRSMGIDLQYSESQLMIYVSNQSNFLHGKLRGNPFGINWGQYLINLPGAKKTKNTHYFVEGHNQRAVMIPYSLIDNKTNDRDFDVTLSS